MAHKFYLLEASHDQTTVTTTSCLTNSFKSCPEEKTPPLADKMITLKSQSTLWSRFDLIAVSIDKERTFLKNKRLDLASVGSNEIFFFLLLFKDVSTKIFWHWFFFLRIHSIRLWVTHVWKGVQFVVEITTCIDGRKTISFFF